MQTSRKRCELSENLQETTYRRSGSDFRNSDGLIFSGRGTSVVVDSNCANNSKTVRGTRKLSTGY